MPELPEVEARRKAAEQVLRGRRIEAVAAAEDRIVFEGVAPRTFARRLAGRRVEAVRRKGKHLWLELDRRPWPTLHFGMGGDFHAYRTPAERPRFWKVEFRTEDGVRLGMTNPRRLGRIRLLEDPAGSSPIRDLGPDPLVELPGPRAFQERLGVRRAPIKAVLLDQSVLAGVGNWIADEVLYQAGIDPRRRGTDLDPRELGAIRRILDRVIRKAVAVDADKDRFPRTWLFHHRWGRDPGARTARGETVRYLTVGGRTTAWVPEVQR